MITLDKIRADMKIQYQLDKDMHTVEVIADTLDDALADASVQLDTKVANLEYEVVERGSAGVFGLAKRPWKIKVYQNAASLEQKKKLLESAALESGSAVTELEENKDRDGLFYVHRFVGGIYLKVTPPVGEGRPVQLQDVLREVQREDTVSFDEKLIKKYVAETTEGAYEVVGEFNHVATGDAILVVDISKDEMVATITVTPPLLGGAEITADMIKSALETQRVNVGIDDEKINEFVDVPVYSGEYVVAHGPVPVNGKDAYIKYHFETDRSKLKFKESDTGQVNFKELNLIQNVVEGQVLAEKVPAEKGKAGKTLFGKYLEATNGRDINLPLGRNVKVDEDGLTIRAAVNGQVMLNENRISVEPILELDTVSIKSGNITFLGTVIVKGAVEDGFDVKASGNIEIYGAVGKSNIEAEGDIVISQGVMGRDEGFIKAGGSIWAKFIQNTKVDAGASIIVNDSIMNSDVTAKKKIILRGKRAQITGGRLRAIEEIAAKNIGAAGAGTETILEVGIDPEKKRRLEELQAKQEGLVKELDELDRNIGTLEDQRNKRRSFPKDKEEMLNTSMARRNEILDENDQITKEIEEIQARLKELKDIGKVSASGTVYAGVKVFVRDEKDEVRSDVKSVTFFYEKGFVRRGKYEAPNMDDIKAPEGVVG